MMILDDKSSCNAWSWGDLNMCTNFHIPLEIRNVNLMVLLSKSQGITKVSGIHPQGNANVWTKFHGIPSHCFEI